MAQGERHLLDVASDLDEEAQAAAEKALDLPTLYASGRAGIASTVEPANGEVPEGEHIVPIGMISPDHVMTPAPLVDYVVAKA